MYIYIYIYRMCMYIYIYVCNSLYVYIYIWYVYFLHIKGIFKMYIMFVISLIDETWDTLWKSAKKCDTELTLCIKALSTKLQVGQMRLVHGKLLLCSLLNRIFLPRGTDEEFPAHTSTRQSECQFEDLGQQTAWVVLLQACESLVTSEHTLRLYSI